MTTEPEPTTVVVNDFDRDLAAETWLRAQHGPDWYIGDAIEADWARAYAAVDADPA